MLKLAIDLGTAVTKIYRIGYGIVLAEATCLTVSRETGEIRAFGNDAKRLLGKTAELTEMVFPVAEGEIVHERYAAALLEFLLGKVAKRAFSSEALFCVPVGISPAAREGYYRVAKAAGISRVSFVPSPFLVALGQDVPLSESNPVFAIDVGAGKTSAAIFSLDGVIAGINMCVGGNNIDTRIIDHVAETCDLKLGPQSSERLKIAVGSLLAGDNQSAVVNGRDFKTGRPRAASVSSGEILPPIRHYLDMILDYSLRLMSRVPAEVAASLCKNGVYLAGGTCALAGFAEYVSEKLNMDAHLAPDVHTAVVLGGGRVVGSDLLKEKLCLAG